jgi:hypothetical protein
VDSDSFDEMVEKFIDAVSKYADCAARQKALVEAWPK